MSSRCCPISPLFSLVTCLAVVACSGATSESKSVRSPDETQVSAKPATPAPPPSPPPEDGAFDVIEAVPMSLFDFEFLASVRDSLRTTTGAAASVPLDGTTTPLEVTADLVATGQKALSAAIGVIFLDGSAELVRVLDEVEASTSRLATLKVDVKLRNGRGVALVHPQPDLYVAVDVDATKAPRKSYVVDTFTPTADDPATLERRSRIELTIDPETDGELHYLNVIDHQGYREYVDMRHDRKRGKLTLDYGSVDAPKQAPRHIAIEITLPGADGTPGLMIGVNGYTGKGKPAVLAPRHYWHSATGTDVAFYSIRFNKPTGGLIAVNAGFIPAEATPTPEITDGFAFAERWGYVRFMHDFLASLLRDPAVHPGCATFGATIKNGLVGKPGAPAQIAFLPDDVCASTAVVTDKNVIDAVLSACQNEVPLKANVRLQKSATRPLDLCAKLLEGFASKNPIYLTIDGDRAVLHPQDYVPTAEHAALQTGLPRPSEAALTIVASTPGFDVPRRPATDF